MPPSVERTEVVTVIKWQPTPLLLPRKSHGWRSVVGCSPWGHKELDTTEQLHSQLQNLNEVWLLYLYWYLWICCLWKALQTLWVQCFSFQRHRPRLPRVVLLCMTVLRWRWSAACPGQQSPQKGPRKFIYLFKRLLQWKGSILQLCKLTFSRPHSGDVGPESLSVLYFRSLSCAHTL